MGQESARSDQFALAVVEVYQFLDSYRGRQKEAPQNFTWQTVDEYPTNISSEEGARQRSNHTLGRTRPAKDKRRRNRHQIDDWRPPGWAKPPKDLDRSNRTVSVSSLALESYPSSQQLANDPAPEPITDGKKQSASTPNSSTPQADTPQKEFEFEFDDSESIDYWGLPIIQTEDERDDDEEQLGIKVLESHENSSNSSEEKLPVFEPPFTATVNVHPPGEEQQQRYNDEQEELSGDLSTQLQHSSTLHNTAQEENDSQDRISQTQIRNRNYETHDWHQGYKTTLEDIKNLRLEVVESKSKAFKAEPTVDANQARGPQQERRQIGLARVHVEVLGLSQQVQSDDDDVSGDESGSQDVQDSGEETNSGRESTGNQSSNNTARSTPSHSSVAPSDREAYDSSAGSSLRPGKRQRRMTPAAKDQKVSRRFRCPYQACEPNQGCFRPGPRNPQGGCTAIQRLKQHLNRRHMRSSRCARCWVSFETRSKFIKHSEQSEPCTPREMPDAERFMNDHQQQELDKLRWSSEEQGWWKIFQLLISGMENRDLLSLKADFGEDYPYYIFFSCDSFMLPSLTFSNVSFQPIEQGYSTAQELMNTGSESGVPGFQDSFHPDNSASFTMLPSMSQELYVPLLEVSQNPDTTATLQPPQGNETIQDGASSGFPGNDASETILAAPTEMPASVTQPLQTSPDTSTIRRNLERLRARNLQTQTENSELRESNRVVRSSLGRADAILEDLLVLDGLPDGIYDKLAEISGVLAEAKDRLH